MYLKQNLFRMVQITKFTLHSCTLADAESTNCLWYNDWTGSCFTVKLCFFDQSMSPRFKKKSQNILSTFQKRSYLIQKRCIIKKVWQRNYQIHSRGVVRCGFLPSLFNGDALFPRKMWCHDSLFPSTCLYHLSTNELTKSAQQMCAVFGGLVILPQGVFWNCLHYLALVLTDL